MMALTRWALKQASSSQKSLGGSIYLTAEEFDSREPSGQWLLSPEFGIVAGSRRVVEGPDTDVSLEHLLERSGNERY